MHFLDDDSFVKHFGDEIMAINTLTALGALRYSHVCVCGLEMVRVISDKKLVFRCNRNNCKAQVSLRIGSLFHESGKGCRQIMRIARCWLKHESRDEAVKSTLFNPETITTWYARFAMLVHRAAACSTELIGGKGIIVEVDEMKIGKRKYNRGHRVEGAWIVNGVERTSRRRVFSVHVERRDSATLQRVISSNVERGSIVYTDCWRGYKGIREACDVEHFTVNHSKHFKDPYTGVCTNTVEGINSAFKSTVSPRHRTDESAPLMSAIFVWRRDNKDRLCDAFIDLLRSYAEENKE